LDRAAVIACAERALSAFKAEDASPPECGFTLLPLQDGALGQRFFLGEVPVSVSHVSLKHKNGTICHGGAVIMRDDIELARSIAILEAVLSQCVEPMPEPAELLRQAIAVSSERDSAMQAAIDRTRVDFSILPGGADAA